ncbi:MAG TPA: GHMP kinase [Anaerolineae bacterium]|nr:GHMP kinase [Anaerolineae bacterium]
MLIARAPVRISLAGGGTDLPAYYEQYGGCVISTSIDKYFYVFLQPSPDADLQITSSDYQTFYRQAGQDPTEFFWGGDLELPRAILHHFGITRGVSMFLASEIPPGTGLGSSSTVSVALVKAITTAKGLKPSPSEIAELASYIEIQKLGMPIGKQDQYAAAYGGLNRIDFEQGRVTVTPLNLSAKTRGRIEQHLMLFFTGSTRSASNILKQQKAASERQDPRVLDALHAVKAMAVQVQGALERGDVEALGDILRESWEQKKQFAANVSNARIDELYQRALAHGARGGKIAGAGGGGFLMLCCAPEKQEEVTRALEAEGLKRMTFHFENGGARVLVNAGLRLNGTAAHVDESS